MIGTAVTNSFYANLAAGKGELALSFFSATDAASADLFQPACEALSLASVVYDPDPETQTPAPVSLQQLPDRLVQMPPSALLFAADLLRQSGREQIDPSSFCQWHRSTASLFSSSQEILEKVRHAIDSRRAQFAKSRQPTLDPSVIRDPELRTIIDLIVRREGINENFSEADAEGPEMEYGESHTVEGREYRKRHQAAFRELLRSYKAVGALRNFPLGQLSIIGRIRLLNFLYLILKEAKEKYNFYGEIIACMVQTSLGIPQKQRGVFFDSILDETRRPTSLVELEKLCCLLLAAEAEHFLDEGSRPRVNQVVVKVALQPYTNPLILIKWVTSFVSSIDSLPSETVVTILEKLLELALDERLVWDLYGKPVTPGTRERMLQRRGHKVGDWVRNTLYRFISVLRDKGKLGPFEKVIYSSELGKQFVKERNESDWETFLEWVCPKWA